MASRSTARVALKLSSSRIVSSPPSQVRPYSKDMGPGKTHLQDKPSQDSKANVQSAASKQGKEAAAARAGGSQATSRKDEGNNNRRAEEDHPEAPKPVIGMNEERGKKGH